MQEFSSISVSSYEPGSLVGALNEQAAAGWDVVSIVPTGSTITAYLWREVDDADADTSNTEPAATAAVIAEPVAEPAIEPAAEPVVEPVEEPATDIADLAAAAVAAEAATDAVDPVNEPAGWAATETAAAEPAAEPVAQAAAQPAAQVAAAAAAAPAGWYADPSSRFELRYWDGSQWTEHVSRGGQQFTDPPVA